ncbi:MAG: GNAT family N-acetyltransferase [Armatimonadetes bacterium]|nr:GNAT family N-acetyltransferase [Armatimonadota bacterium]
MASLLGAPQLVMQRPTLTDLPTLVLPDGYRLRHFEPGDEAAWVRLSDAAFDDGPHEPSWFYERFGDLAFEARRVWFVVDDHGPVATAAAWHRPKWGADTGYLHWVAADAAHRGRGLGLLVSLAAMWEMAREGRRSALLQTDDFRVPAVRAYLTLGYRPRLVDENQRERWRAVLAACGRDVDSFAADLAAPLNPPLD